MWELDHKQSWALKNWCFWTVVLQKTLKSPLDRKGVKLVSPIVSQPWILIKGWCRSSSTWAIWWEEPNHWKRPWCWEILKAKEKGQQNEMVGWHRWLNGHESEQTPGDSGRQGRKVCCSPLQRVRHDLATDQQQIYQKVRRGQMGGVFPEPRGSGQGAHRKIWRAKSTIPYELSRLAQGLPPGGETGGSRIKVEQDGMIEKK